MATVVMRLKARLRNAPRLVLPAMLAIATAFLALAPAAAVHGRPSGAACLSREYQGSRFTVCRYDPASDELRLASAGVQGPLGGFAALKRSLGPDAGRVRFAMNAGMYQPDLGPVGLLVENGAQLHQADVNPGRGNFYLLPNGVFWVDRRGRARITETREFELKGRASASGAGAAWATQSGPLLLDRGRPHPAILPDGESRLIRNGVGTGCRAGAGGAVFVISEDPVSFGRFMGFFRDGPGCADALYLDGSISSLWRPETGRMDSARPLGPMVMVLARRR